MLVTAVVVAVVLASGGGRGGIVATVASGFVAFVALAAFLDAILVPGNPEIRRTTHAAGWAASIGTGGGAGGGTGGGHGGSCS